LDKSGDSKIEKLEINFVDNRGRVVPFVFTVLLVTRLFLLREEVWKMRKNISLDIHSYANVKGGKRKNMILCILK